MFIAFLQTYPIAIIIYALRKLNIFYSIVDPRNVLQNPYLPGYAWLELHAMIPAINILNFTERASFYSITYVNV